MLLLYLIVAFFRIGHPLMEIIYLFSLYLTFLYFNLRLASPWASDNVIITTEAKGWTTLQHIWVPSAWTLQQINELSKYQKCQIELQKSTSIVNIESQEPVFKHLAYLRFLTYFPGLTLHGLVFGHRFIIMAPPAEGSWLPTKSTTTLHLQQLQDLPFPRLERDFQDHWQWQQLLEKVIAVVHVFGGIEHYIEEPYPGQLLRRWSQSLDRLPCSCWHTQVYSQTSPEKGKLVQIIKEGSAHPAGVDVVGIAFLWL